ncbi:Isochorismatase [Methylophaga frappieri]|uniref:Isochorismatase n=1 Tax=Methylophaga frappieri (strain ATCC BAA-2434 / DSM 25690 / JAM7) TaxID=754477 RepID=I1YI03_METFJ|nr:hydrolase [Methylophaga frappieri]AFJ02546.1 Isochorismatase [Methylophaga frappieri]
MKAQTADSVLVVVDIQQKLATAMPKGVRDRVIEQVNILSTAADVLGVPVLVTEQYPKGLGVTEPALAEKLPVGTQIIEKTAFSCADVAPFKQALAKVKRKQIILTGMETHICILQTALDLQNQGYQVYVVEDAVSSRMKGNQYNALHRMRLAGVSISNVESVLFEWLGDALHPDFKTLAKLIV